MNIYTLENTKANYKARKFVRHFKWTASGVEPLLSVMTFYRSGSMVKWGDYINEHKSLNIHIFLQFPQMQITNT